MDTFDKVLIGIIFLALSILAMASCYGISKLEESNSNLEKRVLILETKFNVYEKQALAYGAE